MDKVKKELILNYANQKYNDCEYKYKVSKIINRILIIILILLIIYIL